MSRLLCVVDRQVKGAKGYLFPRKFKVPSAYLRAELGGLMNWTQPLSSNMPVFAAQLAATQEYLQRMNLVPRTATAEQEEDAALFCEVCNTQLDIATRGTCCNPVCENVSCPQCLCTRGGETYCKLCSEALDEEQAEEVELELE